MWALFGIAIVTLFTFVTQQLWNWLIPGLFNGPSLTFWQTAGLLILSKILFSGIGGKHHGHHRGYYWKRKLHNKFSSMTSEEREEFKRRMREKWCPAEKKSEDNANV